MAGRHTFLGFPDTPLDHRRHGVLPLIRCSNLCTLAGPAQIDGPCMLWSIVVEDPGPEAREPPGGVALQEPIPRPLVIRISFTGSRAVCAATCWAHRHALMAHKSTKKHAPFTPCGREWFAIHSIEHRALGRGCAALGELRWRALLAASRTWPSGSSVEVKDMITSTQQKYSTIRRDVWGCHPKTLKPRVSPSDQAAAYNDLRTAVGPQRVTSSPPPPAQTFSSRKSSISTILLCTSIILPAPQQPARVFAVVAHRSSQLGGGSWLAVDRCGPVSSAHLANVQHFQL